MYSTCLFCKSSLGSNEVLEEFPVGRRVAFDGARGRLWVVCRKCGRWNLSPLEERWEVIEACERQFRDTRLKVSTENIGLARLREGLELVRVGSPQRPEMAAWRYGDQLGVRRRRALIAGGLGVGAVAAVYAGAAAAGFGVMFMAGGGGIIDRVVKGDPKRVVATFPTGRGGETVEVRRLDVEKMRILPPPPDGSWRLEVITPKVELLYSGDVAVRAAAQLLPSVNPFGGNRKQLREAVEILEDAGSIDSVFRGVSRWADQVRKSRVSKLPVELRLALEMAAHEEAERRALEGELAELEKAWQEAEEIAAISDSLLLPQSIEDWINKFRGAASPGRPA